MMAMLHLGFVGDALFYRTVRSFILDRPKSRAVVDRALTELRNTLRKVHHGSY
jgi:23S rRNA maturation mini-RNase III